MADDERARMDAALALAGLGSGILPAMEPSKPRGAPKGSRGRGRGGRSSNSRKNLSERTSQSDSNARTTSASSNGGVSFSPPPQTISHIPISQIPQPTYGVAEAKQPQKTSPISSSEISAASNMGAMRKSVLPKVSRHLFLRTKLESKIQKQAESKTQREDINNQPIRDHVQTEPHSVPNQHLDPQPVPVKRKRRGEGKGNRKRHDHLSESNATPLSGFAEGRKVIQQANAAIPISVPQSQPAMSYNYATNEAISEKTHGEFSNAEAMQVKPATTTSSTSVSNARESIPVRNISLDPSQLVSDQTMSPKIDQALAFQQHAISTNAFIQQLHQTAIQALLQGQISVPTTQEQVPIAMPVNVTDAASHLQKGKVPLKLTIPSPNVPGKTVEYSPISPGDNQNPISNVYTSRAMHVPNVHDQSEPLDLSKDTSKGDNTGLSPAAKAQEILPERTIMIPPVTPGSEKLMTSPLQFLTSPLLSKVNFKFVDGKLVCQNKESGQTDIITNPASIGIQVVTDPKTGQTLFIQNPRIQELERQVSRSPGVSRQNSELDVEMEQLKAEIKPKAEDIKPEIKTEPPVSPPKPVRTQSNLPPKKRKIAVDESKEDIPQIPICTPQTVVSPKSLNSNASSYSDEGYGTEHIPISSPTTTSTSALSTTLQKPGLMQHFSAASGGAFPPVSLAQIGNRPTLPGPPTSRPVLVPPTGSSTKLVTSPKLNLSQFSGPRFTNAPTAMSLPVNLDSVDSPPNRLQSTGHMQRESVHELYANRLYDEYQRSVAESPQVQPGRSPFQHFRPSRIKRSNSSTKVNVDLSTGDNWRSSATTKMQHKPPTAKLSPGASMPAAPVVTGHNTPPLPPFANNAVPGATLVRMDQSSTAEHRPRATPVEQNANSSGEKDSPGTVPVVRKDNEGAPQPSNPQPDSTTIDANHHQQANHQPLSRGGPYSHTNRPTDVESERRTDTPEGGDKGRDVEAGGGSGGVAQPDAEITEEAKERCRKAGMADDDGDLPIHLAVVHENLEAVEKLLYMMNVAEINVDHCNNDRQTALHLAVITKNQTILSQLLHAGANPNLPDRKGCTCMHLAVKLNTKDCLMTILQQSLIRPDLNAKNYDGYTALHMSVINRNPEFVNLLLLAGANKDLQDNKSGRTALFHAAELKQFSIASMLLQKGASVNIASYAGTTAAQAANGRGHSDLVALLIKYGADVTSNMREETPRSPHSLTRGSSNSARNVIKNRLKRRNKRIDGSKMGGRSGQAQSLDFDPNNSNDSTSGFAMPRGGQSLSDAIVAKMMAQQQKTDHSPTDGSKPLRIVLPDPGGVAASLPLSPSALGLATRKIVPNIPTMQAKSLPDDVGPINVSTSKQPPNQTNNGARKSPDVAKAPTSASPTIGTETQAHAHLSPTGAFGAFPKVATSPKTLFEAQMQSLMKQQMSTGSSTGLKRTASESSLIMRTPGGFAFPAPLASPSRASPLVKSMTLDLMTDKSPEPPSTLAVVDGKLVVTPITPQPPELDEIPHKKPRLGSPTSEPQSSESKQPASRESILKLKLKLNENAASPGSIQLSKTPTSSMDPNGLSIGKDRIMQTLSMSDQKRKASSNPSAGPKLTQTAVSKIKPFSMDSPKATHVISSVDSPITHEAVQTFQSQSQVQDTRLPRKSPTQRDVPMDSSKEKERLSARNEEEMDQGNESDNSIELSRSLCDGSDIAHLESVEDDVKRTEKDTGALESDGNLVIGTHRDTKDTAMKDAENELEYVETNVQSAEQIQKVSHGYQEQTERSHLPEIKTKSPDTQNDISSSKNVNKEEPICKKDVGENVECEREHEEKSLKADIKFQVKNVVNIVAKNHWSTDIGVKTEQETIRQELVTKPATSVARTQEKETSTLIGKNMPSSSQSEFKTNDNADTVNENQSEEKTVPMPMTVSTETSSKKEEQKSNSSNCDLAIKTGPSILSRKLETVDFQGSSGLRKSNSDHDLVGKASQNDSQQSVSDSELDKDAPNGKDKKMTTGQNKNIFDLIKNSPLKGALS